MKELVRYTKAADQARLARNALAKMITASLRTKDESKVSQSSGV